MSADIGATNSRAKVTVFLEDFEGAQKGDIQGNFWSAYASTTMQLDGYDLVGTDAGEFVFSRSAGANDETGYAVFRTGLLNIDQMTDLEIAMTVKSTDALETSGKWHDHLSIFAVVDGVSHELMVQDGNFEGDCQVLSFTEIPAGQSMRLEIRGKTTGDPEKYLQDNIEISGNHPDGAINTQPERELVTLFHEDFEGQNSGDTVCDTWSVSQSQSMRDDQYALTGVQAGEYSFARSAGAHNDQGYAAFTTDVMDIADITDLQISLNLRASGEMEESGRWNDYLEVYAIVDSVSHKILDQDGNFNSDRQSLTLSEIPEGQELQLEIRGKTTRDSEIFHIDDITIQGVQETLSTSPDPVDK